MSNILSFYDYNFIKCVVIKLKLFSKSILIFMNLFANSNPYYTVSSFIFIYYDCYSNNYGGTIFINLSYILSISSNNIPISFTHTLIFSISLIESYPITSTSYSLVETSNTLTCLTLALSNVIF